MKLESDFHQPALLQKAVEYLRIKDGQLYLDATIGGGGHSELILKKGGRVFGLDRDPGAVKYAQKRLANFCQNFACPLNAFKIVQANFADLSDTLKSNQVTDPAGILFDLGTSLHQLKSKGRGFSFLTDEPLDMRMDKSLNVSAADLVMVLSAKELYELFSKLGEEKYSRAIANDIVRTRRQEAIRSTGQLAAIAIKVYRKYHLKGKIHPATKIFQALRIVVNDELNSLKKALPEALECLKKEGRLVVISFHGLEDKIVKEFFKQKAIEGEVSILTKKPIFAQEDEIRSKPHTRSARMRTAEKL